MARYRLFFRRTFGNRFTRIILTKRGVGLSVGVPGFRRSVHSSGRQTTTVGIPHTGIYWRKSEVSSKAQTTLPPRSGSQSGASTKAGWYVDPLGRYEFRYWDGSAWTARVSSAELITIDDDFGT